ncbi:hypothetical protein PoB_000353300 [Plakobranchus ocellatus]|uniref:Uncharacterized protein n=1 Tax=Plakobranchus ocellatus TaxID=259542 RepID=A0AAV3Y396_9GAST|nr:hypothetical protein PoB_000353300 [Plakobranchus ocellatus]
MVSHCLRCAWTIHIPHGFIGLPLSLLCLDYPYPTRSHRSPSVFAVPGLSISHTVSLVSHCLRCAWSIHILHGLIDLPLSSLCLDYPYPTRSHWSPSVFAVPGLSISHTVS